MLLFFGGTIFCVIIFWGYDVGVNISFDSGLHYVGFGNKRPFGRIHVAITNSNKQKLLASVSNKGPGL